MKNGTHLSRNPEVQKKEAFRFVYEKAAKGNVAAQRTLVQMMGLLTKEVEKHGIIEFGPADYRRVTAKVISAIREDYQQYGGVCPVCGIAAPLSVPTRLDTEQEHGTSNTVDDVPLFSELIEDIRNESRGSDS